MTESVQATPIVKLGDHYLEGSSSYEWRLQAGVAPFETIFVVTEDLARRYRDVVREPLTLTIEGPRSTASFDGVYITEILPGSQPYLRNLRVADRRWLWQRRWLSSTFNLRRTRGTKFLIADDGKPIEKAVVDPVIEYAAFSLYPPESPAAPWTTLNALQYLIEQPAPVGLGSSFDLDGIFDQVEFHDLIIDDQGHHAIERVIALIPNAQIYVDATSTVILYDTTETKDREIAEQLKASGPLVSGPDIRVTDRVKMAPESVISLFTVESEYRFDYAEEGTVERDTPYMNNVLVSPDFQLQLPSGKKVARGSFVNVEQAWETWGAFGYFAKGNIALSHSVLRKHYLKSGGSLLTRMYGARPDKPNDPVNLARIQATLTSWRKLLKVDRDFYDRIETVLPFRAGIVNTETGARAPADVFVDYLRMPSWKNLGSAASANTNAGIFVRGYAALLENAKAAPVSVSVVDRDAGVFRLTPLLDPYGAYQQMVLGYPNDDQNIVTLTGHADANRTGIEARARWDMIELANAHKTAIVLTVVPATPNNARRFYAVEVRADEVGARGEGPPLYSRVFPGVMSAMFGWSDGRRAEFISAIKGQIDWSNLSGQLVNREDVVNVAKANAKRVYETWRDRPLGGADVDLDGGLKLTGSLSSVRHVMAGGATVSQARFTGIQTPIEIWRYLDSSTRRVILRTLNNGAGQ